MKTSLSSSSLLCSVLAFSFLAGAQESQAVKVIPENTKQATVGIERELTAQKLTSQNWSAKPEGRALSSDLRPELDPQADSGLVTNARRSCAFIRTYRVVRPYKDSDFVEHDGYSTCSPLKNLELKSAIKIEDEAEASK
jgi:hypothetical protein